MSRLKPPRPAAAISDSTDDASIPLPTATVTLLRPDRLAGSAALIV